VNLRALAGGERRLDDLMLPPAAEEPRSEVSITAMTASTLSEGRFIRMNRRQPR
jgi:hypothetical protein